MTKFTLVLAASAALLAGPAMAVPGQMQAPIADPITPAQFSIEIGPNHSRWDSSRHRRWESRRDRRHCRTITRHNSDTSRTRRVEICD